MIRIIDFLTIYGIIVSLIFIYVLLKEKNRGLNNDILIIKFLLIFFACCTGYGILHELDWLLYSSSIFDATLLWALGPLMLIYVKSMFQHNKDLIKKNIYHFFPIIIITFFVHIPSIFDIETVYLKIIFKYPLSYWIVRDIYFLLYMIFSIKLFRILKESQSEKLDYTIKRFDWVFKLLFACLGFALIDTVVRILEAYGFHLEIDGGYITFLAIISFLTYLGFHSINEGTLTVPSIVFNVSRKTNPVFSEVEVLKIKNKIENTLENEKLYLDQNLTLKKLSDKIGISEKKLSTYLNGHINTKFTDYINSYRVAEIKEKIKSEKYNQLTLVAISEECGFNSKASFYRIFKKHTGISPAQYKKSFK